MTKNYLCISLLQLQILQSQQALIQKILEDDKVKLNALGQEHLQHLETVTSLPGKYFSLRYFHTLIFKVLMFY